MYVILFVLKTSTNAPNDKDYKQRRKYGLEI